MNKIIQLFAFVLIYSYSFSQNCSGKVDKERGIESFSGITNSQEYYSLMFYKKIFRRGSSAPKYFLFLNAASRVLFTDEMLKSNGTMVLTLKDSTSITLNNVTYSNNPLGFCCTLGFEVELTEDQIKMLSLTPIVSIFAANSLTTTFKDKKQKEQQRILGCLLLKK